MFFRKQFGWNKIYPAWNICVNKNIAWYTLFYRKCAFFLKDWEEKVSIEMGIWEQNVL